MNLIFIFFPIVDDDGDDMLNWIQFSNQSSTHTPKRARERTMPKWSIQKWKFEFNRGTTTTTTRKVNKFQLVMHFFIKWSIIIKPSSSNCVCMHVSVWVFRYSLIYGSIAAIAKESSVFFRMIEKKKKKTIIIIIYFLDHFDFLLLAKQTNKQKKNCTHTHSLTTMVSNNNVWSIFFSSGYFTRFHIHWWMKKKLMNEKLQVCVCVWADKWLFSAFVVGVFFSATFQLDSSFIIIFFFLFDHLRFFFSFIHNLPMIINDDDDDNFQHLIIIIIIVIIMVKKKIMMMIIICLFLENKKDDDDDKW